MGNRMTFNLSSAEAEYLLKLASEDNSLKDAFPKGLEPCRDWRTLTLDRGEAELLRDYLTDRLAFAGLDEHYNPNREGTLLEGLIDKLFLTDEQWSAA